MEKVLGDIISLAYAIIMIMCLSTLSLRVLADAINIVSATKKHQGNLLL